MNLPLITVAKHGPHLNLNAYLKQLKLVDFQTVYTVLLSEEQRNEFNKITSGNYDKIFLLMRIEYDGIYQSMNDIYRKDVLYHRGDLITNIQVNNLVKPYLLEGVFLTRKWGIFNHKIIEAIWDNKTENYVFPTDIVLHYPCDIMICSKFPENTLADLIFKQITKNAIVSWKSIHVNHDVYFNLKKHNNHITHVNGNISMISTYYGVPQLIN